jgi:hypothetical protein
LVASLVLHALIVWVLGPLFMQRVAPSARVQPPLIVTISTAPRIAKRTQPQRAMHRVVQVQTQPQQQRQVAQAPAPREQIVLPHLSRNAKQPPPKHGLTQADLDAQTRQFDKTIAQAKAANNPLAGIANANVKPQTLKRYAFNVAGQVGSPLPNGLLTPTDRRYKGPYTIYYVHYDVEYVDGEQESGDVPWPIRYPSSADPFAEGIHTMPLPGPPPNWTLPAGTDLPPLLKNCYDHRYMYCPIAREGDAS